MLRWLKQVNANGQKEDFRAYYDKALTPAQREVCRIYSYRQVTNEIKSQAYDKEAKELVGDKAVQETRSFVSRSTQMAGPRSLSRPESFTRQLCSRFQWNPHSFRHPFRALKLMQLQDSSLLY